MFVKYIFNTILIVLCCLKLIMSQSEGTTIMPEHYICQRCVCLQNVIDCSDRNISLTFEEMDWEGISDLNPDALDLSVNHLTNMILLPDLPLRVLNISHCEVSKIQEGSFKNLVNLEVLDISFSNLFTLAKGVLSAKVDGPNKTFNNMQYLSLAHNQIHTLPLFAFVSMTSLEILDLSGNPLVSIDQVTLGALSVLVELKELYLSGCALETLPQGLFRRQRRLHVLNLSNNRFTTIPIVLKEAVNVLKLDFDGNLIEVLDSENSIKTMTKLEELRLSRNMKLKSISAYALGGLKNLVKLFITHNLRLSTIDPNFLVFIDDLDHEHWPELKEFYLNNNNFSMINSHFLHRWDYIFVGDFSNNPYVCDCNVQWMIEVLVPLLQRFGDGGENIICSKPSELRGASFYYLWNSTRLLTCPQSENITEYYAPNMAILLGIVIGITLTFPLVLIIVLLWRRGVFSKCRRLQEESDEEATDYFQLSIPTKNFQCMDIGFALNVVQTKTM